VLVLPFRAWNRLYGGKGPSRVQEATVLSAFMEPVCGNDLCEIIRCLVCRAHRNKANFFTLHHVA